MNFIKWHLGDYIAATAHLSWDEDCAYRRLLDVLYKTEAPLPADIGQTCRLVRATTPEQRQAVEQVLAEFFTLTADGWRQSRADKEIEAANAQAGTNRRIAVEREAKRRERADHEPCTSRARSVVDSCTSQTPDTRHQTQTPDPTQKEPTTSLKTKTPPPPKGGDPEGFAEFWDAWPKTERKVARKSCAEKWRKKSLAAYKADILAHLKEMLKTRQWKDGFDPAPLTYLSQERWLDELPECASVGAQSFEGLT